MIHKTTETFKEDHGLSNSEVKLRQERYGMNTIKKKKKLSPIKIFLDQFNDVIIWVLLGATVISGIVGDRADALTIIIIVFMNAILGFVQEFRTEKALEALKTLAAPTSKVIRNGAIKVINSEELVPGDIIILETGDRIPADCVITYSSGVTVDESLLTGESVGVNKNSNKGKNIIFMGTVVLKGKARAKVIETGMNTEMGKIAHMLNSIDEDKSPLKKRLNQLGKIMVYLCIVICVIVSALGIYRGQDPTQMLLTGVSLAVAAIPEGLVAIVTVSLALGVSRMLKRNALVRKLHAVETLGCTSVICSDKTGTLTENKMKVQKIFCSGRVYSDGFNELTVLKKIFTYCNDCNFSFMKRKVEHAVTGDPTETGLIKPFYNKVETLKSTLAIEKRIYDIPFDSSRKMMSVVTELGGKKTAYIKGAPEKIIHKCDRIYIDGKERELTLEYKRQILKTIDDFAGEGLRCIGGAIKYNVNNLNESIEEKLIFVGIAAMKDPLRAEAKKSVKRCKEAGISVVMITGDHKKTAYFIGKELSLCKSLDEVLTGADLEVMSEVELEKKLDNIKVFARVNPEHKLRIVKAFKRKGEIVAMTGDGVNDAPAVKEADIGISMGINGTDVTKEASAMILLDDNFSTIVSSVEEGRKIYDNIRKFIRYLLSCNLGEILTMFLASIFYLKSPLLPIQILFVNLATDGLPALALGIDGAEEDVMLRKPRSSKESIFARGLKEKIFIRGTLIGICTVLAFITAQLFGMTIETSRTIALGTLIISQLLHVFECRSENKTLFSINVLGNKALLGAVFISLLMLLLIIYNPFMQSIFHTVGLSHPQWLIIIFYSNIIAFINNLFSLFDKR
ncbi:cation-translocating P-type ATPase [Oceanirhabdus sp. W0125-5]|uniref:cation-translocating P-type ATPase n=1 Tax=Oceanirhabdus sp. W0125-5 TaxID=2999116 RepID=UPI0022F2F874|nr:cation-translocating P-type ATPase [Oceanirhabdus sp. W0125-5]WBW95402.1 cation-translocating P-type ATPase [Oceanirhabdus sp. W0125-5]